MTRHAATILIAAMLLATTGCVERKLTITSDPPGARVYLDDQELGQTPVTTRFHFYGHRTVTLKKDGYRDTLEVRELKKPFYQQPIIDVFADLGPIPFKDRQTFHFKMDPTPEIDTDALIERGKEMRSHVSGAAGMTAPTKVETEPADAEPAQPPGESPKSR